MQVADYLNDVPLRDAYMMRAYSVLQLYKLYNVIIRADKLGDPIVCRDVYRLIMSSKEFDVTFDELIQLGALLLMPLDDVIVERIAFSVENGWDDCLREALR